MEFSLRIKRLREEREIKQSDLAEILGVSMQSVSAYENGREPNYETLCKIADYFDVTTDYILGKSPYRIPKEVKPRGAGLEALKKQLEDCAAIGADSLITSLNYILDSAISPNEIIYGGVQTLILEDIASLLEKWGSFIRYAGPFASMVNSEIYQGKEGAKNRLYETADDCRSVILNNGKVLLSRLYDKNNSEPQTEKGSEEE